MNATPTRISFLLFIAISLLSAGRTITASPDAQIGKRLGKFIGNEIEGGGGPVSGSSN